MDSLPSAHPGLIPSGDSATEYPSKVLDSGHDCRRKIHGIGSPSCQPAVVRLHRCAEVISPCCEVSAGENSVHATGLPRQARGRDRVEWGPIASVPNGASVDPARDGGAIMRHTRCSGRNGKEHTMAAKRFNETDIDFDAIDGDLAKLAPPKLSAEGRPGPSAGPHGRATGQGRHGGADARSAESTRHRDRGEKPEGLPRQGRAAGTKGGEVHGERHGFGGRQAIRSERLARSAGRERAISLEER